MAKAAGDPEDDLPSGDLLGLDSADLSALERFQIRFVRKTFESQPISRVIRVFQRKFSANWIRTATRNLVRVHGDEHLPSFHTDRSTILVANHRSFFDLYIVSSWLLEQGMPQRLMFPVRSQFFYDSVAGLAVNGAMSFFAMYPPVFRDRDRALNRASVDEVIRVLRAGNAFIGLHPEGKRNQGDDPYTLLPARPGVGRIIHETHGKATVVPVFVNGLVNDAVQQIAGNFNGKGERVNVVFGPPIDFGGMLDEPPSNALHLRISQHALDVVRTLGEQERAVRAAGRA